MTGPERRREIKARVLAASSGPWYSHGEYVAHDDENVTCGVCPHGYYGAHENSCGVDLVAQAGEVDAKFIAGAREDVPWLLAQLDAISRVMYHQSFEGFDDTEGMVRILRILQDGAK